MKKMKLISFLLVVAILMSMLAACGSTNDTSVSPSAPLTTALEPTPVPTEAQNISVKDMMGRELTLDAPATKIVALSASDCEILYAIGAGDTIVGRGEYCDYPAEVSSVPAVESGATTNIEQIIALNPQVLVMTAMSQTKEQVNSLEEAGISVVVSNAQNIDGVYTSIELLGAITGKNAEAAALVSSMKASFDEIKSNAGDGTATVYFETSPLEFGLWTAGSGTFMNEVAEMLGLKNCFSDVESWAEVSQEQVIERNPDYIVTITMYSGEGQTPAEEIAAREGWENVTAVKNGAILNLVNNELSRPGPRLVDGAKQLYEIIFETPTKPE